MRVRTDLVSDQAAKDVLTMAASGGMPDTFWQTDSRISRACAVLQVSPECARRWARWVTQ